MNESVAVITDIHANLPALEVALARIEELAIETVYCGGDLVGLKGVRVDRGSCDPDYLRQLRLRDRLGLRRLRLCLPLLRREIGLYSWSRGRS